jgi:hypothetical protein
VAPAGAEEALQSILVEAAAVAVAVGLKINKKFIHTCLIMRDAAYGAGYLHCLLL